MEPTPDKVEVRVGQVWEGMPGDLFVVECINYAIAMMYCESLDIHIERRTDQMAQYGWKLIKDI